MKIMITTVLWSDGNESEISFEKWLKTYLRQNETFNKLLTLNKLKNLSIDKWTK